MTEPEQIEIRPQLKQEMFLSTSADIAIYGGAAGGGKSYALLLEPLRHIENKKFRGVIFRRTMPQIKNPGGLWDESSYLYTLCQAEAKETQAEWKFPSGAQMKFAHLEYEKNKFDWHGAQIPFIGFDELTLFTESQFFYLMSRNRSMSGVSGYIRATCNADADSWVKDLIVWYLDESTGLARPDRAGKIRYFVRVDDTVQWGNSSDELVEKFCIESRDVKTFTFVPASIYDNKKLLEKDPTYLASLKAMPRVERERLLNGNWNIRPQAGLYFKKEYFETVGAVPIDCQSVRFWDRAATEPSETNKDPDYTVGLKLSRDSAGVFYVDDVVRFRASAFRVEERIKNVALIDGRQVAIGFFQDPGSAGKGEAEYMTRQLVGYKLHVNKISKDKITAASPASSQAEAGNIKVKKAHWNKDFYDEVENFPDATHDDIVDTLSGAIDYFYHVSVGEFPISTGNKLTTRYKQRDTENYTHNGIKVTSY